MGWFVFFFNDTATTEIYTLSLHDALPRSAPHAVEVNVSKLRAALGPALVTRAPGYVLELSADRVDARRFASRAAEGAALVEGDPETAGGILREALALWRGPALADFVFEPFAQADIAR